MAAVIGKLHAKVNAVPASLERTGVTQHAGIPGPAEIHLDSATNLETRHEQTPIYSK